MTSRLVLDEFNLDLSPSGLLVGFGLVIVVVVVLARLAGVGVVDEAVVCGDGGVVEVAAGALGGHGGGRCVGGLRHGLLGEVVALGVEGRIAGQEDTRTLPGWTKACSWCVLGRLFGTACS